MDSELDLWWHEAISGESPVCEPELWMQKTLYLYLYLRLYWKAKRGITYYRRLLSLCSFTHEIIFDYKPGDIYWCTADLGWITGHSYIVYGPLSTELQL